MVRLAVAMAKQIKGLVHVQTNPYYSYSSEKTVINALRMFFNCLLEDRLWPPGRIVDIEQESYSFSNTFNLDLMYHASLSRSRVLGKA